MRVVILVRMLSDENRNPLPLFHPSRLSIPLKRSKV